MLSSLPHTQFAEETGPVPDGGNVLVISGLSFAYQSQAKPLLSEISLSARQGEIIALLGASGCGKSTLLNLIAGLMQPLSGEIRINNDTKCGAGDWQRQRRIGYIFQEDALLPWRTV